MPSDALRIQRLFCRLPSRLRDNPLRFLNGHSVRNVAGSEQRPIRAFHPISDTYFSHISAGAGNRADDLNLFLCLKPPREQSPCSGPRLARAECEISRLQRKHLHIANVPASGLGQVHFRSESSQGGVETRRTRIPSPCAVFLAVNRALAAARDSGEPIRYRPRFASAPCVPWPF